MPDKAKCKRCGHECASAARSIKHLCIGCEYKPSMVKREKKKFVESAPVHRGLSSLNLKRRRKL